MSPRRRLPCGDECRFDGWECGAGDTSLGAVTVGLCKTVVDLALSLGYCLSVSMSDISEGWSASISRGTLGQERESDLPDN